MEVKNFADLNIQVNLKSFVGNSIPLEKLEDKEVIVHHFKIGPSKYPRGNGKCLTMQITVDEKKRVVFTSAGFLMATLESIPEDGFPFRALIIKEDKQFKFAAPKDQSIK